MADPRTTQDLRPQSVKQRLEDGLAACAESLRLSQAERDALAAELAETRRALAAVTDRNEDA